MFNVIEQGRGPDGARCYVCSSASASHPRDRSCGGSGGEAGGRGGRHAPGGSVFVVRVQDGSDPRLPPSPSAGPAGSWPTHNVDVGPSPVLVWRVWGAVLRGPSRDPGWAPYACDPATGPPAGAGRQRHVDPGSGSPPRPSVALHHGPHPGLVGPGRRRAPPAPLPGPVDRRDQPPPRPPVCDGADQRRHRPNAGDRGTSQPSRPLRVPPGPRTPVAQRRQGGGVGWVRLLPLRHRPASRPCHPRPGSDSMSLVGSRRG